MPKPRPRRLTPEEEELSGLQEEIFHDLHGMSREAYDEEQRRFVEELMADERLQDRF